MPFVSLCACRDLVVVIFFLVLGLFDEVTGFDTKEFQKSCKSFNILWNFEILWNF